MSKDAGAGSGGGPDAPVDVTLDEVLDTLRTMLVITSTDPKWLRRGRQITVQYEFTDGDRSLPYHCRSEGPKWTLVPGALPDSDCDVIVATAPATLHGILHGELGGREAMVSGRLRLRKAPSMPMLLVMRGMFNRYTKAAARGTLPTGERDA
ncbi:MAG: hypothetical protein V7637_5620 [Mycobacteriales bacterium]